MKKAGRGSAVDHEPPLPTGAIERHLSTAGTVRPRRGSRGVATFGRDAAFTIPLIRKRRSTLLLDPPMAASGHDGKPRRQHRATAVLGQGDLGPRIRANSGQFAA